MYQWIWVFNWPAKPMYIYFMLVMELWKCILPRVSYSLGQRPRGKWNSWVTIFSYFLNPHAINVVLYRMKPRNHIHVKHCWQAYFKFIGTLSQTFKTHIHKCSRQIVLKAFHRQCCSFWCINAVFYSFFYYFSGLGNDIFQYASMYAIAKSKGMRFVVPADLDRLKIFKLNVLDIDHSGYLCDP